MKKLLTRHAHIFQMLVQAVRVEVQKAGVKHSPVLPALWVPYIRETEGIQ